MTIRVQSGSESIVLPSMGRVTQVLTVATVSGGTCLHSHTGEISSGVSSRLKVAGTSQRPEGRRISSDGKALGIRPPKVVRFPDTIDIYGWKVRGPYAEARQ